MYVIIYLFIVISEKVFFILRILKVKEMLVASRLFIPIERAKESFPFIFRMQSYVRF